jgi:hypothetical protein
MTDKITPLAIFHDGDQEAFHAAAREEQLAWNAYAQKTANDFNNDPSRDTYDSTAVFPGWNRDGKCTPWCPPLFFPEWLEKCKQDKALNEIYMGRKGLFTGLYDRNKQPIHLGDTLEFDEKEWGGLCTFVVSFSEGELQICGTVAGLSEWCRIVKKWDC